MDEDVLHGLQRVELEILLEIDRVCREHGIKYFLDSGTMLGAARHGGFIPWDDDIDISMLRDDYDRFLEIAQDSLGDKYYVQTRKTDPTSFASFAKVRKNGTSCIERTVELGGSHTGIWVDIFPFDTVVNTEENKKRKKRQWRLAHKMLNLRTTSDSANWNTSIWKRVVRKIMRLPLLIVPEEHFYKRIDSLRDFDVPESQVAYTCFHYFTKLPFFLESDLLPLATLSFEGYQLPVMRNWEQYLTDVYGDWRQLPPPEKRKRHEILAVDFGSDD